MDRLAWIISPLICCSLLAGCGSVKKPPQDGPPPTYGRAVQWQPGVTYNGGVPQRTQLCGAELRPLGGGQDDTARIQAAIDGCSPDGVVKLSAGTFTLRASPNGGIFITRSNLTLRGTVDAQGEPTTILRCAPYTDGNGDRVGCGSLIALGTLWYHWGTSTDVAADVAQDAHTVTVKSDPGFQKGELLLVDEETDTGLTWWSKRCSPECLADPGPDGCNYPDCRRWFIRDDRPIGQINEVSSVNGDVVTFSAPFHIGFRASKRAQVTRIQQHDGGALPTTRVGVEDLVLSGGEGGDGGGNLHFFAASYSWARNVTTENSDGTSVNFDGTFRCELRDSFVHSTSNPNPGGGGYGIGFNQYAADNLVENSISWNFNKVMVMRASGGGNVLGYNYLDDGWGAGYPCIVESGMNASHYATSHMELFEGNQAFNFSSDSTWGNSIYVTAHRNFLTGLRGGYGGLGGQCWDFDGRQLCYEDVNNRRAVDLGQGHWWYTFSGNVLGYPGQQPIEHPSTEGQGYQTGFRSEYNGDGDDALVPMWSMGWIDGATQDRQVIATTVRNGNFDWASGRIQWQAGMDQAIPDSLYLTSKPAFMGSDPWPWVDPTTGATTTLPAKTRFNRLQGVPYRTP